MSIYNGLEYACLFGLNAQARGEGITGDVARRERADKGMVGAAVARKQSEREMEGNSLSSSSSSFLGQKNWETSQDIRRGGEHRKASGHGTDQRSERNGGRHSAAPWGEKGRGEWMGVSQTAEC